MLNSSYHLLEDQNISDQLTHRSFVRLQPTSRSRTWPGLASTILNTSILVGLLYGVWICTSTINDTLMPANEYCLHTISSSYNYITFTGEGYGTYRGLRCLNPLRIASTYATGRTVCTEKEIYAGFERIRRECEKNEYTFPDWQKLTANVTDDDIMHMRIVDFEEVPRGTNITEPIRLSKEFIERIGNTLMTWEYEVNWHHRSGFALYGFWSVVIGISTLYHVFKNFRVDSYDITSDKRSQPIRTIWNWTRTNLIIPPTFGSYHQRLLFWCTIPTRMETVIVTAFYLFTTYLSVSHYRLISNNIYWDDRSQQLWRYVADRTGIMSYATLPLIWIFAGRNNVFMWATGLSYQTFNIFHRHIARAGTVLAIVHSMVYTWLYYQFEGSAIFRIEFTQLWFLLGVVATVVMSLLLLFSVPWLRIKCYEVFLVLHIVLSAVVLIGCFLHTSIFEKQYDAYLWPVVVVWILDRGLRLLRLSSCSLTVWFNKGVIHRTHSIASYSKDSDVVRLDISIASLLIDPQAGQFYYLYQPTKWHCCENHPFTLGAWSSGGSALDDNLNPLLSGPSGNDELDGSEEVRRASRYRISGENTLTFWIRPYDGWTKRLRDDCSRSTSQTTRPTILLEGPYGHHCPMSSFSSVLFIVGGTGVVSAIPYILEHMSLMKEGKTDTTHINLLWTVRQASFIREVFERELKPASQRHDFSADLYFTRQEDESRMNEVDEQNTREGSDNFVMPDMKFGRPDITAAIAKAATKAETTGTKVAVLVCGPPAMADEARVAVHRALKRGCHGVEYFEESFRW